MIFEKGKLGIYKIIMGHDNISVQTIGLFKGMEMNGLLTMHQKKDITRYMTSSELSAINDIGADDYMINLGKNATIVVNNEKQAMNLFTIINGVLTIGNEVETIMDNIYKAAEDLFFQQK